MFFFIHFFIKHVLSFTEFKRLIFMGLSLKASAEEGRRGVRLIDRLGYSLEKFSAEVQSPCQSIDGLLIRKTLKRGASKGFEV